MELTLLIICCGVAAFLLVLHGIAMVLRTTGDVLDVYGELLQAARDHQSSEQADASATTESGDIPTASKPDARAVLPTPDAHAAALEDLQKQQPVAPS